MVASLRASTSFATQQHASVSCSNSQLATSSPAAALPNGLKTWCAVAQLHVVSGSDRVCLALQYQCLLTAHFAKRCFT